MVKRETPSAHTQHNTPHPGTNKDVCVRVVVCVCLHANRCGRAYKCAAKRRKVIETLRGGPALIVQISVSVSLWPVLPDVYWRKKKEQLGKKCLALSQNMH